MLYLSVYFAILKLMKPLYPILTFALLTSCTPPLTPTANQAILNVISTEENSLKILRVNGKNRALFSYANQHLVEVGETHFIIRCFNNKQRKSFTKFQITTEPQKVYNIKANCNRKSTIYTISVEGKIIAIQEAKTKFFNNNSNRIAF